MNQKCNSCRFRVIEGELMYYCTVIEDNRYSIQPGPEHVPYMVERKTDEKCRRRFCLFLVFELNVRQICVKVYNILQARSPRTLFSRLNPKDFRAPVNQ